MTPSIFIRRIASDAFEHMIEDRIIAPNDLYDLDGEIFLRTRDGRVETGAFNLLDGGA